MESTDWFSKDSTQTLLQVYCSKLDLEQVLSVKDGNYTEVAGPLKS